MPTVNVYFATNRQPYQPNRRDRAVYADGIAFGAELSTHDGISLRFGKAEVDVQPRGDGELRRVAVAEERLLKATADGQLVFGSRAVFDELRQAVAPDSATLSTGSRPVAYHHSTNDLLVVLHGYANDFEGGIIGAAEIAERLGRPNIFAFCWPSGERAVGVNYHDARKNAEASGKAIGRAFRILLGFLEDLSKRGIRCNRKIDVMAHSMGNYALRHAVQAMRPDLESPSAGALFDNLVLVAADDDADTLENDDGIAPILPYVRRTTVYYTHKDDVLQYSDKVKPNRDRLGQIGPKQMSAVPDSVVAIDVSDAVRGDDDGWLDHWYHRKTPLVVADIRESLRSENPNPAAIGSRQRLSDARRFKLNKQSGRRLGTRRTSRS